MSLLWTTFGGLHNPRTGEEVAVFIRAEQLSAKCSGEIGSRSLDLWHVAAAMEAGCDTFVSFDSRQRKAAGLFGLQVLPAADV